MSGIRARPVVVVAHEATRTGSVGVLLRLLPGLRSLGLGPLAVRLLAEGPNAAALRSFGGADPLDPCPRLVFVNSALAAGILWDYDESVSTVLYVHENRDALFALDDQARSALLRPHGLVLAVSGGVRDDLVSMGVEAGRIRIVPPTVEARDPEPSAVREARAELAEGDRTVVVGCGEASWRKGTDLFVDVIARLSGLRPVRAGWIGRRPRAFGRQLDSDARALGIGESLTWVGEVEDPIPYLAAADVLVMTSREDPQPLVLLEAALAGTPTVAFDLGGLAEFIGSGAALGAPFPDTAEAARAADRLLRQGAEQSRLVERARQIASARSPDNLVPQLLMILRTYVETADAGPSERV